MATYEMRDVIHGKKTLAGFDMPASEVVQENDSHITIKVPGHSRWAGNAPTARVYEPAVFWVFKKIDKIDSDWITGTPDWHNVVEIVEFPVKQPKRLLETFTS